MSSTPRAKPMVAKEGASPRAAPAAKAAGDKKPKAKKPKGAAPTAPISLGMPMTKPSEMSEDAAKADLEQLQKKYGTLVVNFNNQQAELAAAQKQIAFLTEENERLKMQATPGFSADKNMEVMQKQMDKMLEEVRSLEATNMQLQKKVNKMQVEHVSEEEVDQLFYALEQKEQQLEQAMQDKESLEQEVLTARQLSARGGGGEPKFIEIHHHVNEDSDASDDEAAAGEESKSVPVS